MAQMIPNYVSDESNIVASSHLRLAFPQTTFDIVMMRLERSHISFCNALNADKKKGFEETIVYAACWYQR